MSYKYQKEYEEALSRLNAPERTPLPYTPLPYGPVSSKYNYFTWNRIMNETRQGVLPKYSILQRIDLTSQSDLVNVSDDKVYTYTLDPSFTFAKGARKSIAVREVDIYNVIANGETKLANEKLVGGFRLTYRYADDDGNVHTADITFMLGQVSYQCSNDLGVSMANFAQAIGDMVYERLTASSGLNTIASDSYTCTFNSTDWSMLIEIAPRMTVKFIRIDKVDDANGIGPAWMVAQSNIYDYYNVPGTTRFVELDAGVMADPNINSFQIQIPMPNTMIDVRQAAICGSINPWTKNNLISPLTYTSDNLTKVFPYNGSTEIKFWFINQKGEKVRWRLVRGYVDLELIIDNTDSYVMTGDNN